MNRELKSNLRCIEALAPQAISSDTTTDGAAIDLRGYDSCLFALHAGTLTDGTYTPVIEESATGTFTGEETAVADADLTNTEANTAMAATDDNTVKTIGYIGVKDYVRFTLTSASTSTGGTLGCLAILGHSEQKPVPANS